MSNQYLVTTPKNPEYSGKTCGVIFRNGRALVNEFSIDPLLGYSVEEIVERMKTDFGYLVERLTAGTFVDVEGNIVKKRSKAGAAQAPEETNDGKDS